MYSSGSYSYSYSQDYRDPGVDVDLAVDVDDEIRTIRQIVRMVIIAVITAILFICCACFAVGMWANRVANATWPPASAPSSRHRVAVASSLSSAGGRPTSPSD